MTYLLDTHCLVWLLSGHSDYLPKNIEEDIVFYTNSYAVSEMTLVEIVQLRHKGNFELNITPKELRKNLDYLNISVIPLSDGIIYTFHLLPIPTLKNTKHSDPFDRLIISTAIKSKRRLASHDSRFPWYKEHCKLDLLSF